METEVLRFRSTFVSPLNKTFPVISMKERDCVSIIFHVKIEEFSIHRMLSVYLHLLKAIFSLDPDNLRLRCFLGLGALFYCSLFCPLNQPCKTVQVAPILLLLILVP